VDENAFASIVQARPCPTLGRVAPGNFTPRRSQIPDVNLSIHPARATQYRLPPAAETSRFLLLPVDQHTIPTRVTCSLRSTGVTLLPHYYGAVRPWLTHRYFRPRGSSACAFSLTRATQVLKFRTEARIGFTPPPHRTSHGQ
jgi:hypothetical protein